MKGRCHPKGTNRFSLLSPARLFSAPPLLRRRDLINTIPPRSRPMNPVASLYRHPLALLTDLYQLSYGLHLQAPGILYAFIYRGTLIGNAIVQVMRKEYP
jgi:hypothetical protein